MKNTGSSLLSIIDDRLEAKLGRDMDPYFNKKEVAEIMGCSVDHVRKLTNQYKESGGREGLRYSQPKMGGKVYIRKSWIDQYIEAGDVARAEVKA